jgi:hypothetical protein
MEMINQYHPLINGVIRAVVVLTIAFMSYIAASSYIKYQAIDGCYAHSTYEKTIEDQGAKATYPIADITKDCLTKKGL